MERTCAPPGICKLGQGEIARARIADPREASGYLESPIVTVYFAVGRWSPFLSSPFISSFVFICLVSLSIFPLVSPAATWTRMTSRPTEYDDDDDDYCAFSVSVVLRSRHTAAGSNCSFLLFRVPYNARRIPLRVLYKLPPHLLILRYETRSGGLPRPRQPRRARARAAMEEF